MIVPFPARPINGGPLPKARDKRGNWRAELKYNGWRVLIHVPTRTCYNRERGLLSIGDEFKEALTEICCRLDASAFQWVDCEGLERRHGVGRGSLIVLDVIPTAAYAETTYATRREWLTPFIKFNLCPIIGIEPNSAYIAPSFSDPWDAWGIATRANDALGVELYEGIVMKRADSLYPRMHSATDETTDWIKHRWRF